MKRQKAPKNRKRPTFWVGGALVIAAVASGAYWRYRMQHALTSPETMQDLSKQLRDHSDALMGSESGKLLQSKDFAKIEAILLKGAETAEGTAARERLLETCIHAFDRNRVAHFTDADRAQLYSLTLAYLRKHPGETGHGLARSINFSYRLLGKLPAPAHDSVTYAQTVALLEAQAKVPTVSLALEALRGWVPLPAVAARMLEHDMFAAAHQPAIDAFFVIAQLRDMTARSALLTRAASRYNDIPELARPQALRTLVTYRASIQTDLHPLVRDAGLRSTEAWREAFISAVEDAGWQSQFKSELQAAAQATDNPFLKARVAGESMRLPAGGSP